MKQIFLFALILSCINTSVQSQVSTVEFGKNRVQFKKFKWNYYQTPNFNTYFTQGGQELAKFVLQVAEQELPGLETFTEYSMQRRANIVVYNNFNDLQQSNIGLGIDWQNTGGVTKLVNNKMVVYFNGDHQDLRRQIRQGIAKILTANVLFGDDLGEFASNQTLLDLPLWLTDGYVEYAAENWSTTLDDDLKNEILSDKYHRFYQFAFEKPLLAGHAFWYYIEEKYKKENVTYLLYLARVYKNLNRATQQVCKKKFKDVLSEFMQYQAEKYDKDVTHRKNYPKGSEITSVTVGKRVDYFKFNVNPNKRNGSFSVVQYKKGQYRVILNEEDKDKTILKFGVRNYENEINPNYPMMAWDPKGTRLSVLYSQEGHIKLFVFDVVTRIKPYKRDLTEAFDQVTDMTYMLDSKTILFTAVKNGHSDIFTYDIENDKVKQITNDVYDDMNASFVAFPGKTGIIFSSNRPDARSRTADTVLPGARYNIFLITNFGNKPELNQINQLSSQKFGNARYPMQYNTNHFTFVSDENGIANRYAGFFATEKAGLDTLVLIGDEILRNPSTKEVDSTLRAYKKQDVDSIAVVSISNDSAYTFPLTNYESNLRETRIAGDNNQVSEVTKQGDEKILYKLKIDENTLRRRNVNAQTTAYMKRLRELDRIAKGEIVDNNKPLSDSAKKSQDVFQNEFSNEPKDTSAPKRFEVVTPRSTVLENARLYEYKPPKFSTDYVVSGFNNSVLVNKYQLYTGGVGPINLSSSTALDGIIRMGTSDIMEDLKFSGGFRLSTNLKDNDWLFQFQNLRKRIDWGATYYRNVQEFQTNVGPARLLSNLYQASIAYPFDVTKSIRLNIGMRSDRLVAKSYDQVSLLAQDVKTNFGLLHLEYVYDNTLNPAQNIWNGLRYKAYIDWNAQVNKVITTGGRYNFNFGFDARYYYPIYRNFIWAGRAAGDFSWGKQKLIYYLGGVEGWFNPKFNNSNVPAQDQDYAFQSLAVNMRGFEQNAANGNNAVVINSEFRLPVFTTLFNKPINNALLRNFQLTQFFDLGTAWNGAYNKISRPVITYANSNDQTVLVQLKTGGIGPFLGGYGFGARSTLLGYFLKADAGWPMIGFFKGKPMWYFSLGLDF